MQKHVPHSSALKRKLEHSVYFLNSTDLTDILAQILNRVHENSLPFRQDVYLSIRVKLDVPFIPDFWVKSHIKLASFGWRNDWDVVLCAVSVFRLNWADCWRNAFVRDSLFLLVRSVRKTRLSRSCANMNYAVSRKVCVRGVHIRCVEKTDHLVFVSLWGDERPFKGVASLWSCAHTWLSAWFLRPCSWLVCFVAFTLVPSGKISVKFLDQDLLSILPWHIMNHWPFLIHHSAPPRIFNLVRKGLLFQIWDRGCSLRLELPIQSLVCIGFKFRQSYLIYW